MGVDFVGLIVVSLFAITFFVIVINSGLRTFNVSGGVRATAVVLLMFILPSIASICLAFLSKQPHWKHEQRPATVTADFPDQVKLNHQSASAVNFPQQRETFNPPVSAVSANVQTPQIFSVPDWSLLLVLVLAIFGVLIAIQVWLKQQGTTVSMRGLLLGIVSMIWLIPVAMVVLWVSYLAVAKSSRVVPAVESIASAQPTLVSNSANGELAATPQVPPAVSVLIEPTSATPPVAPTSTTPAPPSAQPESPAPKTPDAATVPQPEPATLAKPAAPLPDWVQRGYYEQKESRFYVASSQQFASLDEAQEQALMAAVRIAEADLRANYPGTFHNVVNPEQLKRTAIRNQYNERIERRSSTSGTPFEVQRVYYQVEISPEVYNDFRAEWTAGAVNERLKGLGAFGGFLTLLFGTLSGYLRLDDRTKGAYRGRLRVAAVSLIIAAGVAAAAVI